MAKAAGRQTACVAFRRRLAPPLERDKRRVIREQGSGPVSMGIATALFAIAAAAIVTAWAWVGAAVQMPPSPLASGEKLYCVSYTPFRGRQSPLGPDIPVDPGQIDEDLAQLKHITDCVRTYSVDHGLDQIAAIAKRHGMKVLQGLWLSNLPELSRKQVATVIALAKQFPDVIAAVIVGNEVLLRGEMAAPDLVRTIREVKAQVAMPVTYADVWEFWLRYRDVASAVDFVTIHILPYWEDFPIPARDAAAHVDTIYAQMVAAFPGKDVFVGEFGWPRAGRSPPVCYCRRYSLLVANHGDWDRTRHPDQLDDCERSTREPDCRRLAALACLGCDGLGITCCRCCCPGIWRHRPQFRPNARPRGATPARGRGVWPGRSPYRARCALGAGGAGSGVRPTLPGFSFRAAHRRDSPADAADKSKARSEERSAREVEAAPAGPGG